MKLGCDDHGLGQQIQVPLGKGLKMIKTGTLGEREREAVAMKERESRN
jgi:hypothetical protein